MGQASVRFTFVALQHLNEVRGETLSIVGHAAEWRALVDSGLLQLKVASPQRVQHVRQLLGQVPGLVCCTTSKLSSKLIRPYNHSCSFTTRNAKSLRSSRRLNKQPPLATEPPTGQPGTPAGQSTVPHSSVKFAPAYMSKQRLSGVPAGQPLAFGKEGPCQKARF